MEHTENDYNLYDAILDEIYKFIYSSASRRKGIIHSDKFNRKDPVYKVFLSAATMVSKLNQMPIILPVNIFDYIFHHKYYKMIYIGKADKSLNVYDTLKAIAAFYKTDVSIYEKIYDAYYDRSKK